ncbi:hypothetical protein B0H14DRAFT_3522651 [Mycena olivaceomarginata]|nr:hypothetical protein B0H14DRAFT_3522651 [Mycena olivaceomarginata]
MAFGTSTTRVAYINFMYRQNQKIYKPQIFEEANPTYSVFIQALLNCLGARWSRVPCISDYVEQQMDIIRSAKGTGGFTACEHPLQYISKIEWAVLPALMYMAIAHLRLPAHPVRNMRRSMLPVSGPPQPPQDHASLGLHMYPPLALMQNLPVV